MTLYSKHYLTNTSSYGQPEFSAEFGWGRNLMRSQGLSGQATRFGFKKFNQTKRMGKRLGKAGINRIKTSGTLNKMYSAGRNQLQNIKQKFSS